MGENAVENAIKLCQPLLKLGEDVIKRKSRIPANPEFGVSYMQGNLSITMMQGGIKVNIVPDECVISIARRIIPEEDIDKCEKEIMDALRSMPGVRWDSKLILRTPPVPDTYNDSVTDELAGIIKDVTGTTGKYGHLGSLPIDPVALEWGAKIISTGLAHGLETNAHGKNECVFLKDIEDLSEVIARFIT